MDEIIDPIRKVKIKKLPEEMVRQELLNKMILLGYPKEYIAVEKDLKSLPHLKDTDYKFPQRRIDIICFSKKINIYPILLIECKAEKIDEIAEQQVIGYNYFVNAYFFSLANKEEIKTYWYDKKKNRYLFVDFLPSYKQLIYAIEDKELL
ncbi:MAG: hypothetical protein AMS24_00605 [Chlamydiae bacterium SM23_39]|nr:MAG: hypothetical protein AMS24_00605 [Chlamydiae bacterium SM23_39]